MHFDLHAVRKVASNGCFSDLLTPAKAKEKPSKPCGSKGFLVDDIGLELTRHYVSPCCPVSRSTANKTSVEVVHVRQR